MRSRNFKVVVNSGEKPQRASEKGEHFTVLDVTSIWLLGAGNMKFPMLRGCAARDTVRSHGGSWRIRTYQRDYRLFTLSGFVAILHICMKRYQ